MYLWEAAKNSFGKQGAVLYPEEVCPVCKIEEEMLGLKCGHPICEECLFALLSDRCPICCGEISLDKVKRLLQGAPKWSVLGKVFKHMIRAKGFHEIHISFFVSVLISLIIVIGLRIIVDARTACLWITVGLIILTLTILLKQPPHH